MGKLLVYIKLLENRVFILVRSSLNASVGRLSDIFQILICVGDFILVWIMMDVENVRTPLVKGDTITWKKESYWWKPYKYKICGETLNSGYQITQPQRIHTGEKLCECKLCGKTFIHVRDLNFHQIIHSGKSKFKEYRKAFRHHLHLSEHERIYNII